MKKEKTKKPVLDKSTWLTTRKERSRYYISDLGRTCEGAIITTFMTMFLLMQGLNPAKMAGIMLFVKIIDSLDDVIFGFLVDKLHLDNLEKLKNAVGEGKYLPWFRLTFWLFPIFTVLFFQMPQSLPEWGKLVWFGVFYLLYDLTYTLVEVPMNSLAISITDNVEERNVIIQNRQILNNSVVMLIGIIFYALVSEMVGLPIKWVVVGASVIFLCMMIPMTKGVKEYNTELKNAEEDETA
ncbi:MAG: MFS transporter, partial [Clostridia bacterium]|nr:MFS transporter [Clostridia bacterium]